MIPEPEDQLALHDLVQRYAAYADDRRLDDLTSLFADNGVLVTLAGEFEGRDAIRDHLGVLDTIDLTLHVVGGHVFDVLDETHATGRVVTVAHHVEGGTDHVWHVVYRDGYRKHEGRWFFARRALERLWTEERAVGR